MRPARLALIAGLMLAPIPDAHAQAPSTPPCPYPEHLALHELSLPLARAGMARDGRLIVLTLGGSATAGNAAGDQAATYPARLQADLAAALPGKPVTVLNKANGQRNSPTMPKDLPAMIRETGAQLVIWATGAREAAASADIDDYVARLEKGIDAIHGAGADVILLDLQYAPSIARIINFSPYRNALLGTAASRNVPVLRRYDLMMRWSDEGIMNLDAQVSTERRLVARQLFGGDAAE